MKYGQTLHRRSIPEWGPYNVDYNEIKYLIKARTTKGQGKAISIPGHDNENEFEEQLYVEFCDQHQRINLFVKSKAGEIQRRLTHLDKQISRLATHEAIAKLSRPSVRLMERFSKIEGDVLKAGEELQSLSRFLGANRIAFRKLLKKYKKWTGSATLSRKFHAEVLDQPSNFSQDDFGPLLAHFTDTLAAVRAPFENGTISKFGQRKSSLSSHQSQQTVTASKKRGAHGNSKPASEIRHHQESANRRDSLEDQALDVDFDSAFATLPSTQSGGKATYWVHLDNLIELQVLLLQHTRMRVCRSRASSLSQNDGVPQNSADDSSIKTVTRQRVQDMTGRAIFDDLDRLAGVQSSATIDEVESTAGNMAERAVMSAHWSSSGDAIIILKDAAKDQNSPRRLTAKRKNLSAFFDLDQTSDTLQKVLGGRVSEVSDKQDESISVEDFRSWLASHGDVKPLVQISNNRSRFSGLRNTHNEGTWITLDQDIRMKRAHSESFGDDLDNEAPESDQSDSPTSFPHAVLSVRWEGTSAADLVKLLDKSHLTERVRGFSVEAHALYVLCKPEKLSPPIWLPALGKDILKVPAPEKSANSRDTRSSPEDSSIKATSPSVTSTTGPSSSAFARVGESSATSAPDLLQAPPLSAFKKKRKQPRGFHPQNSKGRESPLHQQRYWNEFDDGSEAGDVAYTIFIDPNATVDYPGKELIQQVGKAITRNVSNMNRKVRAWTVASPSLQSHERASLLGREQALSRSSDDSDIENDLADERPVYSRRLYSTFSSQQEHHNALYREALMFHICLGCFAAAILLLLVGTILASTGRHRAHTQVEIGVLVAVTASLTFSVGGVGMMLARRERLGWPHRVIVLITFAVICIVSGVLLAMVGTG